MRHMLSDSIKLITSRKETLKSSGLVNKDKKREKIKNAYKMLN